VRLVFVTQRVDPSHPALAATIPKIRALAARVDEVVVLALGAVEADLPRNCSVRLFGAPTRVGRGLRFAPAVARSLRGPGPVALLAHMAPIYAVLAAPLARPRGIPVLLWYTHWRATRTLRLAARASTVILSVDARSFPLPSRKVRAIGHGIYLAEFPCRPAPRHDGLRLLALGRTSPAKGLPVVVEAARLAGATLEVRGPSLTREERSHRAELERLGVSVEEAVPRGQVPALFARADALVNNMRSGAPDKVVYEAAASCVPVFASNPVFDRLLPEELRFTRDRPEELAARLEAFAALPVEERERLGRGLRERVEREHSVDSWADRVVQAARLVS
jgi:glycosyltransferase involved in cell wall biosynthesis